MRCFLTVILFCVTSYVNAGTIHPNQFTQFSVTSNNEFSIENNSVAAEFDSLSPVWLTVDLASPAGEFWAESFQADQVSLTVTSDVEISVRVVAAFPNGVMVGGIYQGIPNEVQLNKLLPMNVDLFQLEVKILPMQSPGTLLVENFQVMGEFAVVPEPSAIEFLSSFAVIAVFIVGLRLLSAFLSKW